MKNRVTFYLDNPIQQYHWKEYTLKENDRYKFQKKQVIPGGYTWTAYGNSSAVGTFPYVYGVEDCWNNYVFRYSNVVLNRIRIYNENIQWVISQRLQPGYYPNTTDSKPIKTLENIPASRIRIFEANEINNALFTQQLDYYYHYYDTQTDTDYYVISDTERRVRGYIITPTYAIDTVGGYTRYKLNFNFRTDYSYTEEENNVLVKYMEWMDQHNINNVLPYIRRSYESFTADSTRYLFNGSVAPTYYMNLGNYRYYKRGNIEDNTKYSGGIKDMSVYMEKFPLYYFVDKEDQYGDNISWNIWDKNTTFRTTNKDFAEYVIAIVDEENPYLIKDFYSTQLPSFYFEKNNDDTFTFHDVISMELLGRVIESTSDLSTQSGEYRVWPIGVCNNEDGATNSYCSIGGASPSTSSTNQIWYKESAEESASRAKLMYSGNWPAGASTTDPIIPYQLVVENDGQDVGVITPTEWVSFANYRGSVSQGRKMVASAGDLGKVKVDIDLTQVEHYTSGNKDAYPMNGFDFRTGYWFIMDQIQLPYVWDMWQVADTADDNYDNECNYYGLYQNGNVGVVSISDDTRLNTGEYKNRLYGGRFRKIEKVSVGAGETEVVQTDVLLKPSPVTFGNYIPDNQPGGVHTEYNRLYSNVPSGPFENKSSWWADRTITLSKYPVDNLGSTFDSDNEITIKVENLEWTECNANDWPLRRVNTDGANSQLNLRNLLSYQRLGYNYIKGWCYDYDYLYKGGTTYEDCRYSARKCWYSIGNYHFIQINRLEDYQTTNSEYDRFMGLQTMVVVDSASSNYDTHYGKYIGTFTADYANQNYGDTTKYIITNEYLIKYPYLYDYPDMQSLTYGRMCCNYIDNPSFTDTVVTPDGPVPIYEHSTIDDVKYLQRRIKYIHDIPITKYIGEIGAEDYNTYPSLGYLTNSNMKVEYKRSQNPQYLDPREQDAGYVYTYNRNEYTDGEYIDGFKYFFDSVEHGFFEGSYIRDVTSTIRNTYPDLDRKMGYWYVYQGPEWSSTLVLNGELLHDYVTKEHNFSQSQDILAFGNCASAEIEFIIYEAQNIASRLRFGNRCKFEILPYDENNWQNHGYFYVQKIEYLSDYTARIRAQDIFYRLDTYASNYISTNSSEKVRDTIINISNIIECSNLPDTSKMVNSGINWDATAVSNTLTIRELMEDIAYACGGNFVIENDQIIFVPYRENERPAIITTDYQRFEYDHYSTNPIEKVIISRGGVVIQQASSGSSTLDKEAYVVADNPIYNLITTDGSQASALLQKLTESTISYYPGSLFTYKDKGYKLGDIMTVAGKKFTITGIRIDGNGVTFTSNGTKTSWYSGT